jgi:TPR repeat protein
MSSEYHSELSGYLGCGDTRRVADAIVEMFAREGMRRIDKAPVPLSYEQSKDNNYWSVAVLPGRPGWQVLLSIPRGLFCERGAPDGPIRFVELCDRLNSPGMLREVQDGAGNNPFGFGTVELVADGKGGHTLSGYMWREGEDDAYLWYGNRLREENTEGPSDPLPVEFPPRPGEPGEDYSSWDGEDYQYHARWFAGDALRFWQLTDPWVWVYHGMARGGPMIVPGGVLLTFEWPALDRPYPKTAAEDAAGSDRDEFRSIPGFVYGDGTTIREGDQARLAGGRRTRIVNLVCTGGPGGRPVASGAVIEDASGSWMIDRSNFEGMSLIARASTPAQRPDAKTIETAAEAGDAAAQYELGDLYAAGEGVVQNELLANQWYQKAAEQGHVEAQYQLGRRIYEERGSPHDWDAARRWLEMAARQGHLPAHHRLARLLDLSGGNAEAARWLESAAKLGDESAQYELATRYAKGEGIPQDQTQAAHWFRQAADQGNIQAQYLAGKLSPNPAEAAAYLERAAEQGHLHAQFDLGLAYQLGRGVAPSAEKAMHWYGQAFSQGNLAAHHNLGQFWHWYDLKFFQGDDPAHYAAEAAWMPRLPHSTSADADIGWFHPEAEAGNAVAQWIMGICAEFGIGGAAQDPAEAVRWYKMGTEQQFGPAICNLADKYEHGTGVAPDLAEALRLYLVAAEHKVAAAYFSLGLMYRDGRGVERDAAEAIRWLKEAKKAGWADATQVLDAMPEGDLQRAKALLADCEEAGRDSAKPMPEAETLWECANDVYDFKNPATLPLAFALYMHAAEQGHSEAQLQVAFRYLRGIGVAQDSALAAHWYEKSARQGYIEAQLALAELYESGNGVPPDTDKAKLWYRKAASQGSWQAEYKLDLRSSPEPTFRELGIRLTPLEPPAAGARGTRHPDHGDLVAEFRHSGGSLLFRVYLLLFGSTMTLIGHGANLVGIMALAWLGFDWLSRSKYRVRLYDEAVEETRLFGSTCVTLGPDTRYFLGSPDVSLIGQNPDMAIQDGTTRLELGPRLRKDIASLYEHLKAAEKRDILGRAAEAYRRGQAVDFQVLRLQRGNILVGSGSLPLADVSAVKIANGRFSIHGRNSESTFLTFPLRTVPNLSTLLRLLFAYTDATFSTR